MDIRFRNLEKSELAREATEQRLAPALARFPDLRLEDVVVTLSMENSRTQPGPDQFTVKIHFSTGRYRGITLQKSAGNLYGALAETVDHLLERLNRHGDKTRVKNRNLNRRLQRQAHKLVSNG